MPAASHGIGKVIGVYRRAEDAERAARRARDATGGRATVRKPTKQDRVGELGAEMREEIQNTIVGPGSFGPFTKEMTKGIARMIPVYTLIGAVLLFPFAFIEYGSSSLVARIVMATVTGAVAGAVAGFVVGGGTRASEKEPDTMAAERGVLTVVESDDPEALRKAAGAMADSAIRVDVFDADSPLGEVTTEEEHQHRRETERTASRANATTEVLRDRQEREGL